LGGLEFFFFPKTKILVQTSVQEKFSIGNRFFRRIVHAAQIFLILKEHFSEEQLISRETQARPFLPLAEKSRLVIKKVFSDEAKNIIIDSWRKALEQSEGDPTESDVSDAIALIQPKKQVTPEKRKETAATITYEEESSGESKEEEIEKPKKRKKVVKKKTKNTVIEEQRNDETFTKEDIELCNKVLQIKTKEAFLEYFDDEEVAEAEAQRLNMDNFGMFAVKLMEHRAQIHEDLDNLESQRAELEKAKEEFQEMKKKETLRLTDELQRVVNERLEFSNQLKELENFRRIKEELEEAKLTIQKLKEKDLEKEVSRMTIEESAVEEEPRTSLVQTHIICMEESVSKPAPSTPPGGWKSLSRLRKKKDVQ
jgi:hypothetical protein